MDFMNKEIVLNGENGKKVRFDLLDIIAYLGKRYAVLLPLDYESDEVMILEYSITGNGTHEEYSEVKDDKVLQAVFDIFKNNHKDNFDFEDTEETRSKKTNVKYRSRFILYLIFTFGFWGWHLKWLGFDQEAQEIKNHFGLLRFFTLEYFVYSMTESSQITFGKYREDAYGNPVRYFAFLRNLLNKNK